jgi:hypothetical protein
MLCFICFKCNLCKPSHNGLLKFEIIKRRKKQFYTIFQFKLLNNAIYDFCLLNNVLNTHNHNIRNKKLFYIKPYTHNYMLCTLINILLSNGNSIKNLDFITLSLNILIFIIINFYIYHYLILLLKII